MASAATWDAKKAEKLLEEVGFGERYAEMPRKLETPIYKNFDEGEIVQVGTHEELLMDEKGKYYELWHAQARYYIEKT